MRKIVQKIYALKYDISVRFRNVFWKMLFAEFGSRSNIFGCITVYRPENITFGSRSSINEGCLLNAREKITIGDDVHISPYCILNTGGLEYHKKGIERVHTATPIIIENGVWIGSGVCVNPGVTIGENSVIGAGAVVTKDIPKNTIALGVPARVTGTIE